MISVLLLLLPILCLLSGIIYLAVNLYKITQQKDPLESSTFASESSRSIFLPLEVLDKNSTKTIHELLAVSNELQTINSYKIYISEIEILVQVLSIKKYDSIGKLNNLDNIDAIYSEKAPYLPNAKSLPLISLKNDIQTQKSNSLLQQPKEKLLCRLQNSN